VGLVLILAGCGSYPPVRLKAEDGLVEGDRRFYIDGTEGESIWREGVMASLRPGTARYAWSNEALYGYFRVSSVRRPENEPDYHVVVATGGKELVLKFRPTDHALRVLHYEGAFLRTAEGERPLDGGGILVDMYSQWETPEPFWSPYERRLAAEFKVPWSALGVPGVPKEFSVCIERGPEMRRTAVVMVTP
jgi:hypothetical protein